MFAGIVSIVLAVMIFANLPSASGVVIGVLLGIDLLMTGLTMSMVAIKVRAVSNTVASG